MCSYSMIADHFQQRLPQVYPWANPAGAPLVNGDAPTRAEFEALKREVESMRDLLARAKRYDEENDEPECETADKVKLIRQIAKMVGVDIGAALPAN